MIFEWNQTQVWLQHILYQLYEAFVWLTGGTEKYRTVVLQWHRNTSAIPLAHLSQTGSAFHETSQIIQPGLLLGVIVICDCLPPSCRCVWCDLGTNSTSKSGTHKISGMEKPVAFHWYTLTKLALFFMKLHR